MLTLLNIYTKSFTLANKCDNEKNMIDIKRLEIDKLKEFTLASQ